MSRNNALPEARRLVLKGRIGEPHVVSEPARSGTSEIVGQR